MLISPWAILLKNILETDRVKSPVIKLQSCEKKLRKCLKTKNLGQKQNRAFFMDHPVYAKDVSVTYDFSFYRKIILTCDDKKY